MPQREDRLIGEEWVEHGYRFSPTLDSAEPCIICGRGNNACTEHDGYPREGL